MICHVALYKFEPGAEASMDGFAAALRAATDKAGLSSHFYCGPHIALPADDAVPSSVHPFVAVWEFEDVDLLDEFSSHPAVTEFEEEWARPLVSELAIANYRDDRRYADKEEVDHARST